MKRPVVDYRRAHSPAKPAIAKPHNNGRRDRITVHPPSAAPPRPAPASGRSTEGVKTNHDRGEPSRMDRPRTPRITSPDDRRQPPVRPSRTPEMRTPPPRTSLATSPNVRQKPPETSGPRVTRTPQTARPQSGTLRFYRKEDSRTGSGEKKEAPQYTPGRPDVSRNRPERAIERGQERIAAPSARPVPDSPMRGRDAIRRPLNDMRGNEGSPVVPEQGQPPSFQQKEPRSENRGDDRPGNANRNEAPSRQGRGSWRGAPDNHGNVGRWR